MDLSDLSLINSPLPAVLAQSFPAANTETDLYTVPATERAWIGRIFICNQTAGNDSFRLAIVPNGGATATKNYLYYDMALASKTTTYFDVQCILGPKSVVRFSSAAGDLSITIFGFKA